MVKATAKQKITKLKPPVVSIDKKPKEKMYGNRLREIMTERHMTTQELSDITGIVRSHVSRIINGKRRCISLPIAIKICRALDLSVEEVFIYETPIIVPEQDGE